MIKGYAHNEKLLQEKQAQLHSLKQAVALITNVTSSQALSGDQATGLLRVLSDYAYALDVLDKYDHQILEIEATSPKQLFQITYDSATHAIRGLKDKFGEIPFNYLPALICCMVPMQNHHLNCKFNETTSDTRSVVCV